MMVLNFLTKNVMKHLHTFYFAFYTILLVLIAVVLITSNDRKYNFKTNYLYKFTATWNRGLQSSKFDKSSNKFGKIRLSVVMVSEGADTLYLLTLGNLAIKVVVNLCHWSRWQNSPAAFFIENPVITVPLSTIPIVSSLSLLTPTSTSFLINKYFI